MFSKRNHKNFPDRETIFKYLKGGLTPVERYRIEKLMLENPVLADMIEGFESEDPNLLESDLRELSSAVPSTVVETNKPPTFYRIAASLILFIVSGIVIFYLFTEYEFPFGKQELSMNQEAAEEKQEAATKKSSVDEPAQNITESRQEPEATEDREELTNDTGLETDPPIVEAVAEPQPESDDFEDTSDILAEENLPAEEEEELPAELSETITEGLPGDADGLAAGNGLAASEEDPPVNEPLTETVSLQSDEAPEKKRQLSRQAAAKVEGLALEPRPVNGFPAYEEYLKNNQQYPDPAATEDIRGTVIVAFTIGADSIPRNIIISQSLGYGCDEEAVRLVREGPRWAPQLINGQPTISNVSLEINFPAGEE